MPDFEGRADRLSRRDLLRFLGLGASGAVIASCTPASTAPPPPVATPGSPATIGAESSGSNCPNPLPDASKAAVVDAHAHLIPQFSAAQMVAQMDAAGVSAVNLYPSGPNGDLASQSAIAQFPGRFTTFVQTPDNGPPWPQRGKAFVAYVDSQLATGKFMGIGETNLRFYAQPAPGSTPAPVRTPSIYTAAMDESWIALVDLAMKYKVPMSFHFSTDDPTASAAFEKMLAYSASIPMIWAHLGILDVPVDFNVLNTYLLKYPNLYFDTAAIQNIVGPPYQTWFALTDQSSGVMKDEAKRFFETWNNRVMLATDAGGGNNGAERWQTYDGGPAVPGNPPNSIGRYRRAFSVIEANAVRNIFGANARALLSKQPRPAQQYAVSSGGACQAVSVSSTASVSRVAFDGSTKSLSMTVAESAGTKTSVAVTIPAALAASSFTATVDGASATERQTAGPNGVTLTVDLSGGTRALVIRPA